MKNIKKSIDIKPYEERNLPIQLTIQQSDKDDERKGYIRGMAAVYDQEYRYTVPMTNGGTVDIVEVIRPGAFTQELIDNSDIRAVLNHDENNVLARSKYGAGTMQVRAVDGGLFYEFIPPKSRQDIVETIQRQDIDQCSYRYVIGDEDVKISEQDDGSILREIVGFQKLYDVSINTYPAFEGTKVTYEERSYKELLAAQSPADEPAEFQTEVDQLDISLKVLEVTPIGAEL